MAKKRKRRSCYTSDLGFLLSVGQMLASFLVTRNNPVALALWLVLLMAVFIRCAMKGNDDRIMGFPGLSVTIGILMPMWSAFHYVDAAVPFVWGLPIGIGLTALLCLSVWRKERKEKPWGKALMCLVLGMLIFLLSSLPVNLINTAFDGSIPRQMTATVTEKYTRSSGKGGTVKHVVVSVPGEDAAADFTVPLSAYKALSMGDEVTVTRHGGFLGEPWWELEP